MAVPFLQMSGIYKRFPGVQALEDAGIEVMAGEVHALVGENGAGKSTLMKILNGLLLPDQGEIRINGMPVAIKGPAQAKQLGLAMIYQELNPVRHLTVADNLFLGREKVLGGTFLLDKKEQNRQAQQMVDAFGLKVKAGALMKSLSIGQMQMVEILKAVSAGAKLIVMDEPTSSLAEEEIRMLFSKIAALKEEGVAIIYITHRLDEIARIAQRITVLRDGRYIGTAQVAGLSQAQIIEMMVGRKLSSIYPPKSSQPAGIVLEAKGLSGRAFQDVSFQVKAGEIVGFYGLIGAGRSEVFRAIFGLDPLLDGQLTMDGKKLLVRHPKDAVRAGIKMVPEDRKECGLVLCRSIRENIALPNLRLFSRSMVVNKKKETAQCGHIAQTLRVKMHTINQTAGNLSGGNQQKIVLGKWLMQTPRLLILDEPTRGIDVGAKAEIHEMMRAFANDGMAIVMISSELPEILGMSDRILVMGGGRLKGEFLSGASSQQEILKCALGGAV